MTARHTSDRAATLVRTRTGIVIGGAYVQPPPAPGAEAERIQAALLARPRRAPRLSSLAGALLAVAIGAGIGWWLAEWAAEDTPTGTPVLVDMRATT